VTISFSKRAQLHSVGYVRMNSSYNKLCFTFGAVCPFKFNFVLSLYLA